MKQIIQIHLIPALLACIVFFTTLPFIESVLRIRSAASAAIEWNGVRVLTPVVRPGQVLELVYILKVNKQCPSDQRGFFVAPDGSVPVRMPTVIGGYTKPSQDWREVKVRIPFPAQPDPGLAPFESGEYTYRATSTRYCPDGVEQDNFIPDATFRLEVPNAEGENTPETESSGLGPSVP